MNSASVRSWRPVGAAIGIVLDQCLGEPSTPRHPLVHFGRLMSTLERQNYRDSRVRGSGFALVGTFVGVASGRILGSTAAATYVAVGARMLADTATDVHRALAKDDLEGARALMPSLVGRDPSALDAIEMTRATVESVAENTVDAVVAPVLWAAFLGAPGALGYRALNTLDAMVGHRSARYVRYGWASARLDDVANWFPARATAVLVTAVRPHSAARIYTALRDQAPAHPSPNAGVAEAAFAAALGIELGGRNRYGERIEDRPALGTGRRPEPSDIARAVRLSRDVTFALATLLVVVGVASWRSAR